MPPERSTRLQRTYVVLLFDNPEAALRLPTNEPSSCTPVEELQRCLPYASWEAVSNEEIAIVPDSVL